LRVLRAIPIPAATAEHVVAGARVVCLGVKTKRTASSRGPKRKTPKASERGAEQVIIPA
jgi:hypothetical protein